MRISNIMMHRSVLTNIQKSYEELDDLNYKLSSGKDFRFPGQDPVAATGSMELRTNLTKQEQFQRNITDGLMWMNTVDKTMSDVSGLLHRVRTLAVQGANDPYANPDRMAIGLEIDQILEELVDLANMNFNNRYVFAGAKTLTKPFEIAYGRDEGQESDLPDCPIGGINADRITQVTYHGNSVELRREIDEGTKLSINTIGDDLFFITAHKITMQSDVVHNANVTLNSSEAYNGAIGDPSGPAGTGVFRINGYDIFYNAEVDSLADIADRINTADVGVTATIDSDLSGPRIDRMVLTAKSPSEIWFEDVGDGNLLQKLGFIDESVAPNNIYTPSIAKFEEVRISLFDTLIDLRDHLFQAATDEADARSISNEDIQRLNWGLNNLLAQQADLGARVNRFEVMESRQEDYKLNTREILAETEGADIAETIMNLRLAEAIQQAALSSGARVIRPSLMDFL
ncbi:MAG: flagellar hook-associated protein FlgL [bacterium]